jgi:hypothetical protein
MDPRTAELVEHHAVCRLQTTYGDAVTRRAWDELAALFVPDAPVTLDLRSGSVLRHTGGDEIAGFIAAAVERFEFFEFALLNAVVNLEGDGATGRLYMWELRQDAQTHRWTNAFGLYDMGGNVYEWCRDWYGPYAAGPASDPEQSSPPAGDKARRVLRGGSWLKDAKHLRAAARYRNDPGSRNADNGFRVRAALEVTEKAPLTGANSNAATSGAVTPGAGNESHEWWFVALLLGLIGLFGVASVAVLIISLLRRPRPMPGAPGVTYRPEGDGFRVYAPAGLHGSRLHYRARVPGGPQRAVIPLESSASGQFVYTGAKPQSVEAEQVVAFHVGYAMGAAPQQPSPRDEYVEPPQPAFRGYPSAY